MNLRHRRTTHPAFLPCLLLAVAASLSAAPNAQSQDWPTYQHDPQRSGATDVKLDAPLNEAWQFAAPQPPRPAWPAPAQADYWHKNLDINPSVTYDRAYHVTSAGDTVFFGSSADDHIYALDAETGQLRWTFITDGPVRLAPTIAEGKLYIGSDDGHVYCLDAQTGALVWKRRIGPDDTRVIGNGRMISLWPVRTGLVVDSGVVYGCAGLFPLQGVFVFALNAEDGSELWKSKADSTSPQGYLVVSPTRIYVPRGRVIPQVFDRTSGQLLATPELEGIDKHGGGGSFAILSADAFIFGPRETSELLMVDPTTTDHIATFNGNHMIIDGPISYLHSSDALMALERAKYAAAAQRGKEFQARLELLEQVLRNGSGSDTAELKRQLAEAKIGVRDTAKTLASLHEWKVPCGHPDALIMSGDLLFVGGDTEVAAHRAKDGKQCWTAAVTGRAYGLAAANGSLFVSTDQGVIHCFREGASKRQPNRPAQQQTATIPPRAQQANLAGYFIEKAGVDKGFAVVLNCGDDPLSRDLATQSELKVIALDPREGNVAALRDLLVKTGLNGSRVAAHVLPGETDTLPLPSCFANLVVCLVTSEKRMPLVGPDEMFLTLRPAGGVAYVGSASAEMKPLVEEWMKGASQSNWTLSTENGVWAVAKRDPLPGSADWTHMYADPTNSACSYDTLAHGPVRLQWFGKPGPRQMADRHHRNVAPLCKDGWLVIPGNNVLFGVDAYNGTVRWSAEFPDSRRLGAPFDTNSLAISADNLLYAAIHDTCRVLDAKSGVEKQWLSPPQSLSSQPRHWGYLAVVDNKLLGSTRKPEAVYFDISYRGDAGQWGDNKRMVMSDALFCMDRTSGEVAWTYQRGTIVNPSIAVGGGRVYFIESLNPKFTEHEDGMFRLNEFFSESPARIVALDLATGEKVWDVERDLVKFEQIAYLSYRDEILLASGSYNEGSQLWHILHGMDATSGELLWQQERDTNWHIAGGHGEQTKHPAIVGNTVFAEPHAYNLKTGEHREGWLLDRHGGGCGTISASAQSLFFRGSNPAMYDIAEDTVRHLNRVSRTGCWINMVPAGGMVLVPEASSGCTCPYPLQTSFGYIPEHVR